MKSTVRAEPHTFGPSPHPFGLSLHPFGLSLHPFGLSLSKPFDRLRANGDGSPRDTHD